MQTPSRQPSETKRARIEPLAKLPIFFDLQARSCVVIGGSAAAAWKAELLAAAGAEVTVVAPDPCDDLAALAADPLPAGRIALIERTWTEDDLTGAALVVADAEDDATASAIRAAARDAGAAVNIIDKPAFCDFQFGSIVNRSPVVVGISTDGAAPILGQAIRRRIEAVLPTTLGGWAKGAKSMRERVAARIPDAAGRRALWERIADMAFQDPPGEDAERTVAELASGIAAGARKGRVTLVGAGPGDPEYLTLKAMRALQSADVILFDDLISDGVLELARREAKRMLVGKRGGRASCRQEDINALMIDLARKGKHVVRLKSGDPMIFGRAGEEIAELERRAIPVEVVPGITSALALAARLGTSLTHRDCAHSVRFVTGHSRNGGLPELAWESIADPETTLVVYMGGRTSEPLTRRLIAEGLPASTPAVAGWSIGRDDERVVTGTLGTIAADIKSMGLDGPVLLGIGPVFQTVAFAADNAWPAAVGMSR